MLKNISIKLKEVNFISLTGIIIISILLLTNFVKVLKYSYFELIDVDKYINLSNNVDYFIPKDNQYAEIGQIEGNNNIKFEKNNSKNIYFPEDVQKVWLKLKLQDKQASTDNIIYIDCEFIEDIQFYIPTTDGRYVAEKPNEYFIFPYIKLPENIDFNKDIYINSTWDSNVFNLLLAKDSNFYTIQTLLACFYIGNLGVLLGMLIMNMILFFSSKDSKYLFHSLFTGSLLSLLYCLSGAQKLILGFNSNNRLIALGAMAASTWVLFIYSHLDIKSKMPILNNFFKLSISFLLLSLYISGIIPDGFTYDILYLYIIIVGLCILISIYSYFQFGMGSIYYLFGILILFTGFIIYILGSYGLLEWNIFTFSTCYPAASIETLLFTIGIIKQIKNEKELNNKLQLEVMTDKLTKIYNRRYFEETVANKILQLDKEKHLVSMLILDIDHFKNVNDTYGHSTGDLVLSEIAMIMKHCLRNEDILVRWGGEEFVAVLPFTNLKESTAIAEIIRLSIEKHVFKFVNKVTVSIGIAEKDIDEDFHSWFRRADNALYNAKENGRNAVCVCYTNEVKK
ncbi:GGDEF domain-containing protein [Clostridium beijerinckii]|uniref:GGDEF domain-containing protein n=1 Tax=Clostridium beijerinckii TaxID=1520 RepID=UPI00047CC0CF|nr:GGDEF domain-containing protein [Clostridium beijerinckii]